MKHPLTSYFHSTRRAWLKHSCLITAASATAPLSALAQGDTTPPVSVTQIVDMSPLQQDISRDFLIGSRTAWQEFNAKGGLKGRTVEHKVLETDGSAASVRSAWEAAARNPACVALTGCTGDATASALAELQRDAGSHALPLVAPWLHRQWADKSNTVFQAFPDYQAQIAHAIKSLAVMGVKEAGVVYASAKLQQQLGTSITLAAREQGLKLQIQEFGKKANALPLLVLFIGGTPELHAFASLIGVPQGSHRYLIALADVNLQVLTQLGGVPRNVSVIATQPVPLVSAGLPVVRNYRTALGKLYDEPPSQHGLAGYIAARYTADVLSGMGTPVTRASALSAFRKRSDVLVGGYQIAYQGDRVVSANVTQSMLTSDGRIVG
ncbi:ABC transporter substrate-binding protein [Diaphorobacter sp.]|uniref:ABC transporter substrate-binding protein n=1 Tax=Diaphorobacter sp. TaxID=1934310 RepID=UPI0028AA8A7D|nr:ABC transporter substrate-binding protein [Diaphorobacter sp.]